MQNFVWNVSSYVRYNLWWTEVYQLSSLGPSCAHVCLGVTNISCVSSLSECTWYRSGELRVSVVAPDWYGWDGWLSWECSTGGIEAICHFSGFVVFGFLPSSKKKYLALECWVTLLILSVWDIWILVSKLVCFAQQENLSSVIIFKTTE